MKALISPTEQAGAGQRIAEVDAAGFDIAPPMFWVDVASNVTADGFYWDPVALQAVAIAPTPKPKPVTVTMRQARLALYAAGYLSQIDAMIAAMPDPQKTQFSIYWNHSQTVERHNVVTVALGSALGLTETQMDNLFIAAAAL